MPARCFALALLLTLPHAAAAGCEDLWFSRNQIMNAAGYCFGSALGQATFDNRDCTGKQVVLSPADTAKVQRLRAVERELGCRVDTTSRTLALSDLPIRHTLTDQPVLDRLPGGCLEWQSPAVPLRAGHNVAAQVIGQITPGAWVSYNHLPEGSWAYVTTHGRDWHTLTGGGWYDTARHAGQCRAFIP